MKKKLLAIVMALAMIFTLMPSNYALAAGNSANSLVATSKTGKSAAKSKTVSTEKALKAALKSKKYKSIIISTKKKVKFTIPKGKYTTKTLTVNAPKSDVKNYGKFKSITVKSIAKKTWEEHANGNSIKLTCAAGRVVLSKDKKLKQLIIDRRDMNLDLVVTGDVDEIIVDSTSKVNIKVTGSVGKITVNKRTEVNITGSSDSQIPIEVNAGADGTAFATTVPVNITASANTELTANAGAEGSTVKINDASSKVEVANNSASPVSVTRTDGTKTAIENGKNDIVSGEEVKVPAETPVSAPAVSRPVSQPAITPIEPPQPVTVPESTLQPSTSESNSGSSSSTGGSASASTGGSSTNEPSHDLSRYIRQFSYQPQITAGVFGTPLKSVDEIMKELPAYISQKASDGTTVTFPVTKWNNTDNYNTDSPVGNYSFTADLGTPTPDCIVEDGAKAVVKVCVLAKGSIAVNTYNDNLKNIEKVGEERLGNYLIFKIKNNNAEDVDISGSIKYYKNGNLQNNQGYLDIGSAIIKAGEETEISSNISGIDYDSYTMEVSVGQAANAISMSDISVSTKEETSEYGKILAIEITNNSGMYIGNGDYIITYTNNGVPVHYAISSFRNIPSGETKRYTSDADIRKWNDETRKYEQVMYDAVKVTIMKVSSISAAEGEKENQFIINSYNDSLKNIEKVSEEKLGNYQVFKIKNNNAEDVDISGSIKYYKNGNLQNIQGYLDIGSAIIKAGEETEISSNISGIDYDSYTMEVSVGQAANAISMSDISVSTKEETSEYGKILAIEITNNSGMYIGNGDYIITYTNNGVPVHYAISSFGNIPSGETKRYTSDADIRKRNDETKSYESVTYDSVEVYIMNLSSVSE